MLVLAIDTSSEVVVAALTDGRGVLATSTQPGAQAHGELLAPGIDAVLREAGRAPGELTHVVVGVGPGPFTGLRVGVVTALVMGEALGASVRGVCSLDAVALAAAGQHGITTPFAVVTDARRKEVYVARYDETGRRLSEPVVVRPDDLDDDVRRGPVVGAGAGMYADRFADVHGSEQVTALAAHPLYLRRPDAVENAARKRVTPS